MVVLVTMSAYFSATETAFSSLSKTRLKTMIEKGDRRAELALSLSEQYDKLISTILIGNNIVNIALSSLATVFFIGLIGDNGATLSTVVITVIVLIFGEITPKSVAKDHPEGFAKASAPVLNGLIFVLTPINFLFSKWKALLARLLKSEANTAMSQEELLMLVDEVEEEGTIDTNEGNLLRNAIEFTERRADDILTHRIDLEGVEKNVGHEEISNRFEETKFSRLLVYEETIDNVIGVIHQKDFYSAEGISTLPISELLTPVVFVQRSEKVNDILMNLQKEKTHVAVVLDEYGGTLGIVTMEDILEELVGEIWDEHDEVVERFEELEENLYRVNVSVNMDEFCRFFDVRVESECSLLSGFVTELLGKLPELGDSVQYENLLITVSETEIHRMITVDVKVLPTLTESEEKEEAATAED